MSKLLARNSWFFLEPLESRKHLSVSLDADGFSVVTPSPDTRTIYVSNRLGSDSNDGLSSDAPVRTIARGVSLLRDGFPDHLLLRRGDTFNENLGGEVWDKSGRSPDEPLLISSYGEGPRPLLETGSQHGIFTMNGAVESVAIIGLAFHATSPNAFGVFWLAPTNSLLIEDSSFDDYGSGMVLEGNGLRRNVTMRRSVITDSAGQGIYVDQTDHLLLEENVLDHNGWNDAYGSVPTVRKHSIYIKEGCTNLTVRGNIIADSSSHGLQARSGGIIENNLFLDNPIGLSFGLVNGSPVTPGGVTGRISGNVFLGSRDIGGLARGWAMEIANIKPGSGTVISNNIIAHDTQKIPNTAAIWLSYGSEITNPTEEVGINDLTLEGNIVYDWYSALGFNDGLIPGGVGPTALNGLNVRDNQFSQMISSLIVNHASAFNPLAESWQDNIYNDNSDPSKWFSLKGLPTSLSSWMSTLEPTASASIPAYPDPNRDIGSYDASIGGAGTDDSFISQARLQSHSNWRPAYTATKAIGYMFGGFYRSGDLNLDGTVTIADLIALLANFGKTGQGWSSGDLNGDDTVGIADLIDLTSNYQRTLDTAAAPAVATATPAAPADLALAVDSGPSADNNTAVVGSPTPGSSQPRCLNCGIWRSLPLAEQVPLFDSSLDQSAGWLRGLRLGHVRSLFEK